MRTAISMTASMTAEVACLGVAVLSFLMLFTGPDEWLLPTVVHAAGGIGWFINAVIIQRQREAGL